MYVLRAQRLVRVCSGAHDSGDFAGVGDWSPGFGNAVTVLGAWICKLLP